MEKKFYSDRVGVEINLYNKPSLCKPFSIEGDLYKTKDVATQTRDFSTLDMSVVIFNKKLDLWVRVEGT
jgi:hypothetical protein